MKRIIFLISFLIFFGCVWGQSALCPSNDYNTFLMSVADQGPADLVNENAYETKEQKFDLTYDLINLTQDVIQARIELYRYLDEDAMNEGWKLERTLYFSPPFSSTIPLLFDDLKKGKTYSITLIVTTDMPNILLQDNSAPIDITTKTLYFLWPKEHGMHLSATTSYEGEPRRQHFKVKWSSTTGSSKTRIKAHHSNNTENPVLETPPEGEMTFPREEVWNWPIEDLSSVSVDALDGAGNVIGSTGIVIGPDLPLKDLRVLPCKPIPINPSEPELSSQYDKVLNDGNVEAVVSYKYGGAFFTLRFIPYCCNNNGKPFNLVNNLKDQPGAGGLLWQTAFVRKNDKWKQWDNLDPIRSEWSQETWEITNSYPDCIHGDKFKWNPTQGGQEANACEGQEVTNENKWDNQQLYKHNGTNSWTTSAPMYVNPSLNDDATEIYLSPIKYTSSFKFWYQLNDTTYSNHTWNFPDAYEGQPQGAMKSTIQFIPSINNDSSGIEVSNSILIHCPCAKDTSPPCHCKETYSVLNKGGTNQLSYNFQAAIQDNVFFGSEKVTKTYFFDPTSTVNRYGMVKRTPCQKDANGNYDPDALNCLCPSGENSCLEKKGWKKDVKNPESHNAISENWVPYALMSTPNDEAWILIYNDNDFSKNGETAEIRRIIQTGLQENVPEIVGCNTFPFTSIPALTDDLNPNPETDPDPIDLKSVIFVGPTLDSVMEHLQSYSCGQWPRLTTGFYISGIVSGAISSGVTITLSGASAATTTTDSSGNYTFANLANGDYTITPSKAGYTFTPANYSVTISGADVTGKNFTATVVPVYYTISGTITLNGSGFSGVTVTAGSQSATTSSTGAYTISGLANGTYTVTPSKSGYTFSPANYSVTISGANVTGKDFTATVVPVYYTISGTITLNGSGFSGVTVTAGSQSATTSSTGAYTISGLANGTYTVTPSKSGYTFSPANYSVTISGANVTGKDFTATASTCSGYTITLVNNYCTSSINPSLSCYPAGSSVTVSAASDCQLNGGNICPNFNYWGISVNNGSETKNYSNELNYTIPSGTGTIQFKAYYTGSQCSSSRVAGKVTDSSDNAIAGIKMKMGTIEQSTDDKGEFTFIDLPSGDYILEPSEEDKAKYDFDPPSRNIHIQGNGDQHKNQDFKVKLK